MTSPTLTQVRRAHERASTIMMKASLDALELGNQLDACGVQCSFECFVRSNRIPQFEGQLIADALEALGFPF